MWKLAKIWAMFRKELTLAWFMLRDARTPVAAKVTAILALLYIVSPVDLIPDLVPVLGWLDDGLMAVMLLALAKKFLPPDLLDSLRARAAASAGGKAAPKADVVDVEVRPTRLGRM